MYLGVLRARSNQPAVCVRAIINNTVGRFSSVSVSVFSLAGQHHEASLSLSVR